MKISAKSKKIASEIKLRVLFFAFSVTKLGVLKNRKNQNAITNIQSEKNKNIPKEGKKSDIANPNGEKRSKS
jgi:hypothetical protein